MPAINRHMAQYTLPMSMLAWNILWLDLCYGNQGASERVGRSRDSRAILHPVATSFKLRHCIILETVNSGDNGIAGVLRARPRVGGALASHERLAPYRLRCENTMPTVVLERLWSLQ